MLMFNPIGLRAHACTHKLCLRIPLWTSRQQHADVYGDEWKLTEVQHPHKLVQVDQVYGRTIRDALTCAHNGRAY
jgi:hypothetical protein